MRRRRFLARAGVVGSVGLLAGCPDLGPSETETPARETDGRRTATETPAGGSVEIPEEYHQRFDDVVDLGDAGADPDASKPLNPVLDRAASDDTLLFLPEGRYRMDGQWSRQEFDNFGVYGPNATVVPPGTYAGNLFVVGGDGPSRDLLVDGLHFDVSEADSGPRVLHATVSDGLLVRDLTVTGLQDTDQGLTRFDVTDPDGQGRVERMGMPDGGDPGTVATGCLVGPRSEGTISFRDCHIAGFPDNGLYASPAPGAVNVYGGRYANNGIANVRVSDGSEVRGVHVVCDEAREGVPNMRGIRLREGADALVEGCRIEMLDVTESGGAITLSSDMRSATITDTAIRVDADYVPAIRAKPLSDDGSDGENQLTCENVSIVGSAAEGESVSVVDRSSPAFDGLCLHQTGARRDGFLFLRSSDAVVTDSQVSVTGEPVVTRESSVRTDGLDVRGATSCDPAQFSAVRSDRTVETRQ